MVIASSGEVTPEQYGAKGDGVILVHTAMTAGSATLTCSDSWCHFTSADIGKVILVSGVGAANADLVTTIASINSTTSVQLAVAASSSSPDPSGIGVAVYGTDDTAAIQAASDAAAAANGAYGGTVRFDHKTYIINGPLVQGGSRFTNSQITLPWGGSPVGIGRLRWRGAADSSGTPSVGFVNQSGTVLVSTLIGGSYSATYGIPSVVGSATGEQRSSSFSGWLFSPEKLTLLCPRNPSLSGFNCERVSGANRRQLTVGTLEWGYPQTGQETLSIAVPSNPSACAWLSPSQGNQQGASGQGDLFTTWGFFVGICPGEHDDWRNVRFMSTRIPIGIQNGFSHPCRFGFVSSETNPYVISGWDRTKSTAAAAIVQVPFKPGGQANANGVYIDALDLEDYSDGASGGDSWAVLVNHVNDPSNNLTGYCRFTRFTYVSGVFQSSSALVVSGGSNYRVQRNGVATGVGLEQDVFDTLMPWTLVIPPFGAVSDAALKTGTWSTFGLAAGALYGQFVYNSSNAQNDEIGFDLALAAGTWTLTLVYAKQTNTAIITVNLDGSSVGTIDSYAASNTNSNSASIAGITVATNGKHRVSFKAATKNTSSSGWIIALQHIQLRRTA